MQIKNLFNYAPKELSQDAFIMWVFDNYDCEELKDVAYDFICFLTKGKDGKPIVDIRSDGFKKLKVWSQVSHMDVGCDFYFGNEEDYATKYLVIEDKVGSSEHDNQLTKYSATIKKWDVKAKKEDRAIKVYYKTFPLSEWEKKRVEEAGWKVKPFDEIIDFWKKYQNHPNQIISFYARHISGIGESAKTTLKPSTNDLVAWKSFFDKTVIPTLKERGLDVDFVCDQTRYGYVYLNIYPKGSNHDETPYLEIRSRDNLEREYLARVLKYGKNIDSDSFDLLRQAIADNQSKVFKANWGKKRVQQAGRTNSDKRLSCENEDALVESILLSTKEYLQIISDWKSRIGNRK